MTEMWIASNEPRVDRAWTGRSGEQAADPESRAWVEALAGSGPSRDAAVARLLALLTRAARFEISRRSATLAHVRGGDREDLAEQCAHDALLAVLAKLESFRGDSRFTTWAYKFAILEAAVTLRRLAWQGRELPLTDEGWEAFASSAPDPESGSEQAELLKAVQTAIATELTPHQRDVLVATTLNDVPIDVLAERLNTSRGALYKTLHDARRKLRRHMADSGLMVEGDAR
jgi:RNA polymerase sigma-70 factor, ECF subfamily